MKKVEHVGSRRVSGLVLCVCAVWVCSLGVIFLCVNVVVGVGEGERFWLGGCLRGWLGSLATLRVL